jgi:hypothetical protein
MFVHQTRQHCYYTLTTHLLYVHSGNKQTRWDNNRATTRGSDEVDGPDDANCIVWAIGMFFLVLFILLNLPTFLLLGSYYDNTLWYDYNYHQPVATTTSRRHHAASLRRSRRRRRGATSPPSRATATRRQNAATQYYRRRVPCHHGPRRQHTTTANKGQCQVNDSDGNLYDDNASSPTIVDNTRAMTTVGPDDATGIVWA